MQLKNTDANKCRQLAKFQTFKYERKLTKRHRAQAAGGENETDFDLVEKIKRGHATLWNALFLAKNK